jgi:hypothetical protein
LGKNGSKIGKMGYFPNFQEKSGTGPAVSGAAHITPKTADCRPLFPLSV